jgi:hypothetical protein
MKMKHKDVKYSHLSDLFIFDVYANVYFYNFFIHQTGLWKSRYKLFTLVDLYANVYFYNFFIHLKSQQVSSIFFEELLLRLEILCADHEDRTYLRGLGHQLSFVIKFDWIFPSSIRLDFYFLIKLGIKPSIHLLEIGIFSLCLVIVRPTKIINRADKKWAPF